jgi:hypothetical protein
VFSTIQACRDSLPEIPKAVCKTWTFPAALPPWSGACGPILNRDEKYTSHGLQKKKPLISRTNSNGTSPNNELKPSNEASVYRHLDIFTNIMDKDGSSVLDVQTMPKKVSISK